MKEFLDNLQLTSSKASALKEARKEVSRHFEVLKNQDVLITNIKLLMGLRDINLGSLSVSAGRDRTYVSRLLGKNFPKFDPSVETIRGLAFTLGVKPSTLVFADLRQELQAVLNKIEGRS